MDMSYIIWAAVTGFMRDIGKVVTGILYDVVTPIVAFMLATPLCVAGLGLSFCGAGFGFVKRAFKTSRR